MVLMRPVHVSGINSIPSRRTPPRISVVNATSALHGQEKKSSPPPPEGTPRLGAQNAQEVRRDQKDHPVADIAVRGCLKKVVHEWDDHDQGDSQLIVPRERPRQAPIAPPPPPVETVQRPPFIPSEPIDSVITQSRASICSRPRISITVRKINESSRQKPTGRIWQPRYQWRRNWSPSSIAETAGRSW